MSEIKLKMEEAARTEGGRDTVEVRDTSDVTLVMQIHWSEAAVQIVCSTCWMCLSHTAQKHDRPS